MLTDCKNSACNLACICSILVSAKTGSVCSSICSSSQVGVPGSEVGVALPEDKFEEILENCVSKSGGLWGFIGCFWFVGFGFVRTGVSQT